MEDIKGKELDLCPKNKKRCIFNQSHWKNSNGLSRKCIGCLETSPPPLIKYKEIMTKAELKEEYQKVVLCVS